MHEQLNVTYGLTSHLCFLSVLSFTLFDESLVICLLWVGALEMRDRGLHTYSGSLIKLWLVIVDYSDLMIRRARRGCLLLEIR